MIEFRGTKIKCGDLHDHLVLTGGEVQVKRSYFWGLQGHSEIVATPGLWTATCRVWLNDITFTTRRKLNDYRDTLRTMKGEHGELIEKMANGQVSESWKEATFEGFEETPFNGHTSAGPIQDPTGALNGSWLTQGVLRWTLLSSERGPK